MATPFRVAVVGAGPSGLTFASILSREAQGELSVDVFERDSRERDQGAGWDVDHAGQAALRRAGVDLARISREGSDTFRVFRVGQPEPLLVPGLPGVIKRVSHRFWPPCPETNRHAMREGLLNALDSRSASVHFGRAAADLRLVESTGQAELLDRTGRSMGCYDLVVDAGGVASPLRRCRVAEPPDMEQHYTGITMLYGVIPDPESVCTPTHLRQLGQGTLSLLGPLRNGNGTVVFLQRFGARAEDRRATIGIMFQRDHIGDLADELGLARHSRVLTDAEPHELRRVQGWIKEQLSDQWRDLHKVVDSSVSLSVRPILCFPFAPTLRHGNLPLVCIGDALHALPSYTGSSGNLALVDAAALATALCEFLSEQDLDRTHLLEVLRSQEQSMIERARPVGEQEKSARELVLRILQTPHYLEECSTYKLFRGDGWTMWSAAAFALYSVIHILHRLDGFGMSDH